MGTNVFIPWDKNSLQIIWKIIYFSENKIFANPEDENKYPREPLCPHVLKS
jgi:hypothetical protein